MTQKSTEEVHQLVLNLVAQGKFDECRNHIEGRWLRVEPRPVFQKIPINHDCWSEPLIAKGVGDGSTVVRRVACNIPS